MGLLISWIRLVRFHEYGPLSIMVCLSGALLATDDLDFRLVQLVAYTVFGSISAFVINDLSDISDDLAARKFRNPLVTGDLSMRAVLASFTLTASLSITSLVGLNIYAYALGLTTLALSYQYSIGFRLKGLVPADLITHGLVPSLLSITSYVTYRDVGIDALILASMTFTASCVAELLQEIRDLSTSSTASYLGVKRSKDLALILTIIASTLYASLTIIRADLSYLIIYLPSSYLVINPLLRFRKGYISSEEVINELRHRITLIAVAILTTYLTLKLL